jgi:putative phage-type endonuclease
MNTRTQYLGGSDCASILSLSPWKTPLMLYEEKIGAYQEEVTPKKQRIFERGHRWEEIVIEMLVDELQDQGHDVKVLDRNQRYTDSEYQFIRAEIDVELLIDGEEVNGEAKTVSPFAAKFWGETGSDEFPVYYQAQTMHGLMVKPRRRCVVAAMTGFDDTPKIHWIERDEETIAAIRSKELEFWHCVQNRIAPEPSNLADLSYLFKQDTGIIIEADDKLLELCMDIKHLKSDSKTLEKQLEELTFTLKKTMGDAAILNYAGCTIATWKNNKSSDKTDWQALAKELNPSLELIKKYTKTVPGIRPLLIK